jgi:hypothetical protein
MIVAAALGVLAGIVGFSPLMLARHLAIRGSQTVREQSIPIGVGLVFVSLMVLMAILFVASRVAPASFLASGAGTVAAFLAASLVLAVTEMRRPK